MKHNNKFWMRPLMALLMIMVLGVASSYAIFDKYTINRDNLPQEAQQMLDTYFPKAKIGMIKVDKHLLKKTDYDVKLVNGTKIEFSNAGKWTSVDCGSKAVPDELVPKAIRNYVTKNFGDLKIVKITKKSLYYEIGLADGVALKFDLLGIYQGVISMND